MLDIEYAEMQKELQSLSYINTQIELHELAGMGEILTTIMNVKAENLLL